MRPNDLHRAYHLLYRLGFTFDLPSGSFILQQDTVIKGDIYRLKHVLPMNVLMTVNNWPFTLRLFRLECEERWNKMVREKFSYRKEHGYERGKFG